MSGPNDPDFCECGQAWDRHDPYYCTEDLLGKDLPRAEMVAFLTHPLAKLGFTHADVELLRQVDDYNAGSRDAVKRLNDLADRIAALLPPK